MSQRRPAFVTILFIIVLILTAGYGLRLYETLIYWQTLLEYHAFPGPVYMTGSSLVWIAVGLLILVGIATRAAWTRHVTRWGVVLFSAWWWVDRLFIQSGHAVSLLPALLTFFMLLFIFVGFGHLDVKLYFKQKEKHG